MAAWCFSHSRHRLPAPLLCQCPVSWFLLFCDYVLPTSSSSPIIAQANEDTAVLLWHQRCPRKDRKGGFLHHQCCLHPHHILQTASGNSQRVNLLSNSETLLRRNPTLSLNSTCFQHIWNNLCVWNLLFQLLCFRSLNSDHIFHINSA